jgi:DNA-binding PadR family transcriptional regulator
MVLPQIVRTERFGPYCRIANVSTHRLTDTSYAVLGLVDLTGEATPYQLKRIAQNSLFHFWTIPHTQLYSESARLAEIGLLHEHREESGRRRRIYRLTAAGRKALHGWRADPSTDVYELRDPGLLKLFCGSDPMPLAQSQLESHKQRLQSYEQVARTDIPEQTRLVLESGIGHEREYISFWSRILGQQISEP